MVLASKGVWVSFWTPKPLKSTPQDTQTFLWRISQNVNLKHIIYIFPLHMIPMTLYNDIMPYVDKFIHVNGWNLGILWSPLKIWTPKHFTIANFGHPVSKSWLKPWLSWLLQSRHKKVCVYSWGADESKIIHGFTWCALGDGYLIYWFPKPIKVE